MRQPDTFADASPLARIIAQRGQSGKENLSRYLIDMRVLRRPLERTNEKSLAAFLG